jgi:hypothetical protein
MLYRYKCKNNTYKFTNKKEAIKMATLMNTKTKKKSGLNDEFEKYLDKQRGYTTFNGTEVAKFSSYKKLLGLK